MAAALIGSLSLAMIHDQPYVSVHDVGVGFVGMGVAVSALTGRPLDGWAPRGIAVGLAALAFALEWALGGQLQSVVLEVALLLAVGAVLDRFRAGTGLLTVVVTCVLIATPLAVRQAFEMLRIGDFGLVGVPFLLLGATAPVFAGLLARSERPARDAATAWHIAVGLSATSALTALHGLWLYADYPARLAYDLGAPRWVFSVHNVLWPGPMPLLCGVMVGVAARVADRRRPVLWALAATYALHVGSGLAWAFLHTTRAGLVFLR